MDGVSKEELKFMDDFIGVMKGIIEERVSFARENGMTFPRAMDLLTSAICSLKIKLVYDNLSRRDFDNKELRAAINDYCKRDFDIKKRTFKKYLDRN